MNSTGTWLADQISGADIGKGCEAGCETGNGDGLELVGMSVSACSATGKDDVITLS